MRRVLSCLRLTSTIELKVRMKHTTVEFTMKWGTLVIITEAKTDMLEIRLLVQQMSYILRCHGQETQDRGCLDP
jgi:hypothetical protein